MFILHCVLKNFNVIFDKSMLSLINWDRIIADEEHINIHMLLPLVSDVIDWFLMLFSSTCIKCVDVKLLVDFFVLSLTAVHYR